MAPAETVDGDGGTTPPDISLEEIIFSCDICQATVSEVYATKEHHDGFHSGSSSDDGNGIVTKFWIGACSHIFCGKHLDGGGVAFHPKYEPPSAGCPVCPKNLPSSRTQALFAIRGLTPGEYDDIIPDSWLRCPPTRLDAQDDEMDALRFQYQRLASYSRNVHKAWKVADSKRRTVETALSSERKQWRKRETESKEAIKERDALIEERDEELKKWNSRKGVINHYMGIVGPMAKEIADMRTLLVQLGYEVPERDYSYKPKAKAKPSVVEEQPQQIDRHDSSATLGSNVRTSSASRKRKADNDPYADSQEQGLVEAQPEPRNNRAMMPPPLPKFRPPRQLAPARQSLPQQQTQQSQQRNSSDQSRVQPRQQYTDPRGQQPQASRQQFTRDTQQTIPQLHEQTSQYTQHNASQSRQQLSYVGEHQPAPQPAVQLYNGGGWQNRPLPNAAPSVRDGLQAPCQTQQMPAPMQRGLPYHDVQPSARDERSIRETRYDQPPIRAPLQPTFRQQERVPPSSRQSFRESGGWRGATPREQIGGREHQPTYLQPNQPQQVAGPLHNALPYRQSRRAPVGHNGSTTLSCEYRAQERSTTAQRQTGLFSQPAKRRLPQQVPFSTAGDNAYHHAQPYEPPEVSHYDPVYGTRAQQSGEDAPRELYGFHMPPPPAPAAARGPLENGGRHRLMTPAHVKHLEPPAASSVASPFFGQSSQRQSGTTQRSAREPPSYAQPPATFARSSVAGHYQMNDGMPPRTSTYTYPDRGMSTRDTTASVRPETGFLDNSNGTASTSEYARGSKKSSRTVRVGPPPPAVPRGRMSLPSATRSSHRYAAGDGGAAGASSYDTQSLFSGAGPTRRSIRR